MSTALEVAAVGRSTRRRKQPPFDPYGDAAAFEEFVEFFRHVFRRKDFLATSGASQEKRDYVRTYYKKTFVRAKGVESRHWKWFRRLEPIFQTLARESRLLDYGGGYGLDAIFLASRGYDVVLCDLTEDHLAIARWLKARWEDAHDRLELTFVKVERGAMPPAGRFDAVLVDEVAHHVEPAEWLFKGFARLLHPGGRVFLLEPNAWSPVTQAYFLKVRGLTKTMWRVDDAGEWYLYGHENIRTAGQWAELLAKADFEVMDTRWIIPWTLTRPTRELLERLPGVNRIAATHVTLQFRLRPP